MDGTIEKKRSRSFDTGSAVIKYEQRLQHRTSIPKNKSRFWSEKELNILKDSVERLSGTVSIKRNFWSEVSKLVATRTGKECAQCWEKVANPKIKKGRWSEKEDDKLMKLLRKATKTEGKIKWSVISKKMKTRSSKQCRERWINQLDPDLKRGEWREEEKQKLLNLYEKYPNKWSIIASQLPGRNQNTVKYRYLQLNGTMKVNQPHGNMSFCDDMGNASRNIYVPRHTKQRICTDKQIKVETEDAISLQISLFQNQGYNTEDWESEISVHEKNPWRELAEILGEGESDIENFTESETYYIMELLDNIE